MQCNDEKFLSNINRKTISIWFRTGTSTAGSNQIRYPPTAVAYSQFSPLTAASIRQVCFPYH